MTGQQKVRPGNSFPDAKGQAVLLEVNSAPGAFVRLVPAFDTVEGRNGTLKFKLNPSEALHSRSGQAVKHGLKAGGLDPSALRIERFRLQPRRVSESWRLDGDSGPSYCVVKLLAIAADDALDGKVEAPLGAT